MTNETLLTRKDKGVGDGPFDSIAWAMEVHVKVPDKGKYKAAVLYGNEDSPGMIDFYTQSKPKITDKVIYRWTPVGATI